LLDRRRGVVRGRWSARAREATRLRTLTGWLRRSDIIPASTMSGARSLGDRRGPFIYYIQVRRVGACAAKRTSAGTWRENPLTDLGFRGDKYGDSGRECHSRFHVHP
jgi:hypothetical protein